MKDTKLIDGQAPGPSLVGPRLLLRRPRRADMEAWSDILVDAELCRYTGGAAPRITAWSRVLAAAGSWDLLGFGLFSIVELSTGRWAGCIGPWCPPGWPGNEVGWRLAPWAQGKGYASEAAELTLEWVFGSLGWDRVIHCIHPDNAASIRLAERIGASLAGPVALPAPLEQEGLLCWSQSADQWRARRRSAPPARPT
jgi:RimJ/RimL family protein N-acetyltransferase